jgi:alkanesulfonate monooxygenase SsuD/methylene tetrahydromethanopterin reductase-like flavin-dependent oxidoreductase (luciferase family)
MNTWVSKDGRIPESVLEAMWHQIGTYRMWHAEATEREPIDEAHLRARTFAGTPEAVIDQAGSWIQAFPGRDIQVIFRLHYPGMSRGVAEDAMELFSSDVLPALRKL